MASSLSSHLPTRLSLAKKLQLCCLWYSSIRNYSKRKKYDYNLNALIDWKNKTNLAFGGPRKLTKSGKLRKSKNNENEKLQSTLEAMSAQSTHLRQHTFGIENKPYDVFDVGSSSSSVMPKINISEDSLNRDFFIQQAMSSKTENHAIGTIENADPLSETVSFNCSTDSPTVFSKYSKKRTDNEDDSHRDAIHIPVISPIPSGKIRTHKSYNDITESISGQSNKKPFKSEKLPSEPPVSFDLINSIPLDFSQNSVNRDLSNKMLKFKEDVDLLSLRSPPSVKSILNKTMPDLNRFFLNRWRQKMIEELGEEGFKAHQDATINRGINFHANVMELLSGKSETDIQIMPDNEGHWASLQTAMKHISDVRALEEDMQHPALLYRGVADCVAKYKDVLCVIDWKTSKKARPLLKNTYDDPIQVAAYMGLFNANKESLKIEEINHGLLVIIYPDGNPAHIHLMNQTVCHQYWQDWTGRLYQYYQLVYTQKFGGS